jgi:autotransporter-associated beta strand protein
MLRSWYQKLAAMKVPTSGRLRQRVARRRRGFRPQLESLEARLLLYDHVWSDGSNFLSDGLWSDPGQWSNGSPAGDPDPDGAVVIFPEAAGSSWDDNQEDIPGELPVKSLYYHRGGFNTYTFLRDDSLLLSRDIFTDLAGTNEVGVNIRFTSGPNFEHNIQVNNSGLLILSGNLTSDRDAVLRKDGNGTLELGADNPDYAGTIDLHQGTLLLGSANALTSATHFGNWDTGAILDLNNFDVSTSVQTAVQGLIRLGSGNLSISGVSLADIEGTILGSGGLTVASNDAYVTLGAHGTFSYTGPTTVNAGTLFADGTLGNHAITVQGSGTLSGGGTVGAVTVGFGGIVHPGSGGTHGSGLTSQGNVIFESGSSFQADIRGSATNQYDHLTATGPIDLSNAPTLVVTGGANSAEGDTFTILHSSAGISGTFAGLANGVTFVSDHKMFRISYTGTDVTLTHLPQFAPPVSYAAGGGPRAVVTGDFNGDGIPDLAVADASGAVDVSVLLGNGDGTFQSPRPLYVQDGAYALTVGHFHDPNILDLVVTERSRIEVFLGNGDGTFRAPVAYPLDWQAGAPVVGAVVGDVNGDGADDLVVVNSNSHALGILYGNGDGTFQPAVTLAFPSPGYAESVALADLNGDGKLDLVTGNSYGTNGDASAVSVLLNQGNDAAGHAQFGPAVDYLTHMDVLSLAVRDLNGDGFPDVIFVSDSGQVLGVFLGNGDGTLKGPPLLSPTSFSSGGYSLLAIEDFDGDGQLDVSVPARFGREAVLYGKGDGTFGPPSYYAMASSAWAVATGDFNGDGAPDLAVAVHDGTVGILLNAVARGGSVSQPGGHANSPSAPLPDRGAAGLVPLGGSGGTGTLAALPLVSRADNVPPLASRAPEIAAVDRLFAVVGRQASGLAISRRRLRTVPLLDEVPPWEADWLARDSLAGGGQEK